MTHPSRVVLFGGTFNPPHRSHRRILVSAMAELGAPHALVLPTGRHPLKTDADLAPDAARRALCEVAFADLPGVRVDTIDQRGSDPCYTIDTVRILQRRWPEARLFWLIGSDNLRILSAWRDVHELMQLVTLVTFPRIGYPIDRANLAAQGLDATEIATLLEHVLDLPPDDVSATAIRAELRSGGQPAELDHRVAERIRALGLYTS